MFQVRFHGRGGQGVVTAAELLAAAAFSDGRHAQASPSFGSEWMGAPVMSFCRIDGKPIRTHEPVSEPDALVIQDPTLLHQADLFAGLGHDGYLLINSTHGFEVPEPEITDDGDVILRVDATTICGTDLHILAGDVPEVRPGRILGHEAVGTVVEAGEGVHTLAPGERVLVSCISACGTCQYCRQGRYGQCLAGGGWILGHKIDGTQAEYVRVPFADTSTFRIPAGVTDEEALMLADILPTGYEVGVLAGGVRPGDVVAVVGTGPVGLSAITCAQLFSPSHIVAIDRSDARLDAAKQFGADVIVNNTREDPLAVIRELTGRLGADVSIEAVGTPATFELAVSLIRPSGRIANIGVHGRQGRHDPPGAHVQEQGLQAPRHRCRWPPDGDHQPGRRAVCFRPLGPRDPQPDHPRRAPRGVPRRPRRLHDFSERRRGDPDRRPGNNEVGHEIVRRVRHVPGVVAVRDRLSYFAPEG